MEGIRNQLNKLDKDQTDYEEKHDNRCFSMLNVIKKNSGLRKDLDAEEKKILNMKKMYEDIGSKMHA